MPLFYIHDNKGGDYMSGSTGEKCPASGKYKCSTHSTSVIYLSKDETFPPCSHNGNSHGATWTKVG